MNNMVDTTEKIYCSSCGKELKGNSKFCGFCGAKISVKIANKPKQVTALYCKNVALKSEGDARLIAIADMVSALSKENVFVPFYISDDSGTMPENFGMWLRAETVTSEDDKTYLPVFLHEMQIPEECKKSYTVLSLDYVKLTALAAQNSDIAGFVFDPFTDPLCVSFELIKEAYHAAEKKYVLYNKSVGENFPAVDKSGSAWVFTNVDYANAVVEKNKGIDFSIREFSEKTFKEFVTGWYALGIDKFSVNIGTAESYTVSVGDYLQGAQVSEFTGSKLNSMIIRYKQLRSIVQNSMAEDAINKIREEFCELLKKSIFVVPIDVSDRADLFDEYYYVSDTAQKIINEIYNGNVNFYGENNCRIPDVEILDQMNSCNPEIQVASSNGKTFIPAFTEITSLRAVFDSDDKLALYAYEDISSLAIGDGESFDNEIAGIVINPAQTSLVLMKEDLIRISEG